MMTSFFNKLSVGLVGATAIAMGATIAAPAQAQTVISGFTTGGDDMDGMEILVNFIDGTSQQAIWGTTGNNAGGAFGTGWDLTFSSSTTFGSPWTFNVDSGLSVSSLMINAIPGNTMFDTNWSGSGTPGSALGRTFNTTHGQTPDSYQYTNPIDISVGDLFGSLSMIWNDGFSGTMKFIADTDNGTVDNPVTVAQAVPEPASIVSLLAIGVMGAGSTLKRKKAEKA